MFFLLDIKEFFTYGKIIANCEKSAEAKMADAHGTTVRGVRSRQRLYARFWIMPDMFSRTCGEW